ncbi:PREDICTED: uncharacterized protein LOC108564609 [Nicrophorus vespilloides]|uniref:Uncharacterized protein LOC108564609 n=1 Tax=Nicrophorus vespilloides TaxID=110193 RepID=A0ABM1MX99_NICVS|nr:PREDICTED: uncharacterized protein LOC108564609 [Nicrophorus vespilloides]
MFLKVLLVSIVAMAWLVPRTETAPAVTQFLPPIPGYIPVYIRPGNTPLEDINVDLAEAFKNYGEKHSSSPSQNALTTILETHIQKIKPKRA